MMTIFRFSRGGHCKGTENKTKSEAIIIAKLNGVKVLEATGGQVTEVEYDGVIYEKVDGHAFKDAKEGDLVFNVADRLDAPIGYYAVEEDGYVIDDEDDEHREIQEYGFLFRAKPAPFKTGDIVVITGNTNSSVNKVGNIGKITEFDFGDPHARVEVPNGSTVANWTKLTEIRHATGAEKAEYERKVAPQPPTPGDDYEEISAYDAEEGDFVWYDESPEYSITEGKFYEINEIDCADDPQITDDDGDDYDTVGEDFRVFRKITEDEEVPFKVGDIIAGKPTAPYTYTNKNMTRGVVVGTGENPPYPGDDIRIEIIEHSGNHPSNASYSVHSKHFEFAKAREGDTVEMLTDDEAGDYAKGDRFLVEIGVNDYEVIRDNDGDKRYINVHDHLEYKVVKAAEDKPKTDPRAAFEKGDKVRLVSGGDGSGLYGFKNGEEYEVGNPSTSYWNGERIEIVTSGGANGYALPEQLEKVVDTTPSTITHNGAEYTLVDRKARPGDVVVFEKDDNPEWLINSVKYYTVHDDDTGGVIFYGEDGDKYRVYAFDRTESTVKVYASVAKPADFKPGDYAKLKTNRGALRGFSAGDIVKLHDNSVGASDFDVRKPDGSRGFTDADNLEPVEEKDVKWTKIGRKLNEFKKGDIVTPSDTYSPEFTVLAESEIRSGSVGFETRSVSISSVDLVAPVEARFDRKHTQEDE